MVKKNNLCKVINIISSVIKITKNDSYVVLEKTWLTQWQEKFPVNKYTENKKTVDLL